MTVSDYCTVYRRVGKLVIAKLGKDILAEVGTEVISFARVTDPERLLNYVAEHIRQTEPPHENHETNLDHSVRAVLRSASDDVPRAITDNVPEVPETA